MTNQIQNSIEYIPVDSISLRESALRKVDPTSSHARDIAFSIQKYGMVFKNVVVIRDPENEGKYIMDDGAHRLWGSQQAGLSTIPAMIVDIEEDELNFTQIMLNCQSKADSPMVVAKAIKRLMVNPKFASLTTQEFKDKLGFIDRSEGWFKNQLSLGNLIPEAEQLVEEGAIKISAAYTLATLPADEQIDFLETAEKETIEVFQLAVAERKEELKAKKKGLDPEKADPLKQARLRKMTALKVRIGEHESAVLNLPPKENFTDSEKVIFEAGRTLGRYDELMYVVSLDPETVGEKDRVKKEKAANREKLVERRKELMAAQKKERDETLAAEGLVA